MSDTPVNNNNYGDDAIMTLSPLEHIRLRPGMYIGRLGNGSHQDDGIYILLKEIIDNSIDEFIMGWAPFPRRPIYIPGRKRICSNAERVLMSC